MLSRGRSSYNVIIYVLILNVLIPPLVKINRQVYLFNKESHSPGLTGVQHTNLQTL